MICLWPQCGCTGSPCLSQEPPETLFNLVPQKATGAIDMLCSCLDRLFCVLTAAAEGFAVFCLRLHSDGDHGLQTLNEA